MTASLESPVSHQAGAPQGGLPPDPRTPPSRLDALVLAGSYRLPHETGHGEWAEPEAGARDGQGQGQEKSEAHLELLEQTLTSCLEDTQAVARGRARGQASPAAVCFLPSGLPPKANKPGWENEADLEEGSARLGGSAGNLRAPLELRSLLVTLTGQNPRLAEDPKPGLLAMETLHAASGNNISDASLLSPTHARGLGGQDHSWRHSAGATGFHAARMAAWPSPGTAGKVPQSVPCSVFAGEKEALDKGLANIWDCIQSVR